jgi:hypothetical protein
LELPPAAPVKGTIAQEPQGFGGSGYYTAGGGEWGERGVIDLQVMPIGWFEFKGESRQQPGLEAGTANGYGYGVRAAFGNRDQSVGVLYQGFDLDGDRTDVAFHAVCLDFDVRAYLQERGARFFVQTGGGLGAVWIDYDPQFDDVSDGIAQLRLSLGIEPSPSFSASLGLGGVWFGHPGETEGYGTFLLLSASLNF